MVREPSVLVPEGHGTQQHLHFVPGLQGAAAALCAAAVLATHQSALPPPVPHESMKKASCSPCRSTTALNTASADGDRQMLPEHGAPEAAIGGRQCVLHQPVMLLLRAQRTKADEEHADAAVRACGADGHGSQSALVMKPPGWLQGAAQRNA